jgi:hypothetical protein
LLDHLSGYLSGFLGWHLPGPATAAWSALGRRGGLRRTTNTRKLLWLDSGLRFGFMHLRYEEARQDAAMLRGGLSGCLRGRRSGIERGPQGLRFGLSDPLSWHLGLLRGNGDVAGCAARLGFDGECPPDAVAQRVDPEGESFGLCRDTLLPSMPSRGMLVESAEHHV